MELSSAPVYRTPGARGIIDRLVDGMKLLCAFPSHEQAPAARAEIRSVRESDPEIYVAALGEVLPLFAARDALISGDVACGRCQGSGRYAIWGAGHEVYVRRPGIPRICGCPAGERARGLTPLTAIQVLNPEVFQVEEQIPLFSSS